MVIQVFLSPKPIGYHSCIQPSYSVGSDLWEVIYLHNYSVSVLTVFLYSLPLMSEAAKTITYSKNLMKACAEMSKPCVCSTSEQNNLLAGGVSMKLKTLHEGGW